ncbi:MAG: hypothetical protein NTX50_03840 [Candidatus Sumerlaeota bacterium]|nr:hypothetical protein [Candidatus Sumerlaeota bacterium]
MQQQTIKSKAVAEASRAAKRDLEELRKFFFKGIKSGRKEQSFPGKKQTASATSK